MDFSKHLQKAEQALERRNTDYAIELYRQLIDLDPDLGEARAGLRRALVARHETRGKGRLLRTVSGALPLGKARTLRKLGKLDACARALEDYLALSPLDVEANLELGTALEEAGHLRSARAVYEFLAEIAPRNPEALKRAGAMLRHGGEPERALEYYERALAADPRDRDALRARKDLAAETALSRSEGKDGEVRHSRDLVEDAEGLKRLERSRRRHLSAEDLRAERERLEAELAAPADPEGAQAPAEEARKRAELARVLERLGDAEQALEQAERALALRPGSYDLAVHAGDLRTKLLKRAIAAADGGGEAARATELEAELRAWEVADHERRVHLRPTDPALRIALARRRMRAGDLDAAIADLQKARNDARVRAEALFHLARCFRRKGILDLAEKTFRQALEETDPASERAKETLYELGAIAESRGDVAQARSCYVRIYELDIGYRDVADKMETL